MDNLVKNFHDHEYKFYAHNGQLINFTEKDLAGKSFFVVDDESFFFAIRIFLQVLMGWMAYSSMPKPNHSNFINLLVMFSRETCQI